MRAQVTPMTIQRSLTCILVLCALGAAAAQEPIQPTIEQLREFRTMLSTFESVDAARDAGFEQFGECMSSAQGGQGIHFTVGDRIGDPTLDPLAPEALMYERRSDGTLRLVGAEFIVFQAAWHDTGAAAAPALFGREFSLNTTLLDEPFYALHVWAWQHNPLGIFANWNPLVGCEHATARGH